MFLGAGTSQALMGVPDAVPGRDVLVPFFIVSMDGFGNENALIILTEVGGLDAVTADDTDVHLTVWNRDSVHVHNEAIEYTAKDVWFTDGLTLINKMSPQARATCEVDLDGNEVNDHYIGYVYFDNPRKANNLIAHAYQVDVGEGIVAGYLPSTLETFQEGHNPMVQGYYSIDNILQDFNLEDVEAFNANALWAAKCFELGLEPVGSATNLMLYPRFYLHDEFATNFLVVWTDEEAEDTVDGNPEIPLPGSVTINFYNEEEKVQSAPVIIDHELNIIDITDIVPDGLYQLPEIDWPHGGWIDLDILGSAFNPQRYILAHIIQRCVLDATTTLDVIFEAHRDAAGTSTIGG
jgi:hypothetical protein